MAVPKEPMMMLEAEREELAVFSKRLVPDGLCIGTAGNLSIRAGDVLAITPSGVSYDALRAEAMCIVDLDGQVLEAPSPPSSEVPMHLAVYRTTNATAVVHTHSPYATVLSTVVDELPPVHYVIAGLGGRVRVAPYSTFGTQDLADNMARVLEGRSAVILQNHGTITYGRTLSQAYERALTLEWLCAIYWRAKVFGVPHILPDEEIDRVRAAARVKGYRAASAPGR
jgi:L-fuculose-phosphate aldolase